jgi:molecular chaperone DnaK (HSP70)
MTHVLGIDFGTTNSCISYYCPDSDYVKVISNPQGNYTTPSCISFVENQILVGDPTAGNHRNKVTNIKRLIGLDWKGLTAQPQLAQFFQRKGISLEAGADGEIIITWFGDQNENSYENRKTVNEIIRIYLQWCLQVANQTTGINFNDVVITVPAYFNDLQRQTMKHILDSLGVNVIRIVNEPTAAALAYGARITKQEPAHGEELVLVVDCGGGTTDVSLVHMDYQEQFFEVKAVLGDNYLGGEDLTCGLVEYVIAKTPLPKLTTKQREKLHRECERCKCTLSFVTSTDLFIDFEPEFVFKISRRKFIESNQIWFDKLKNYLKEVTFGYTQQISKVVLVGGTSRIPLISQMCQEIVGHQAPICNSLDPDQTVSIGAAVQGYLLRKCKNDQINNQIVVTDVLNMTLGIETLGGLMVAMISKNTTIPVSRTQVFTNTEDYVDNIEIKIYQGERKFVQDNCFLGSFKLVNLDNHLKRGEMNIRVTFSVDSNGIVSIRAEDAKTKTTSEIVITDSNQFINNRQQQSTAELETLLTDSINANKVLAKLKLHDTVKYLMALYHDNREQIQLKEVNLKQLNLLFSETINMIDHFESYSAEQLSDAKTKLERQFHSLLMKPIESIQTD